MRASAAGIRLRVREAELLVDLVRGGLATAARGIMYVGNRPIEVTRLTITDLGRQALAG